MHDRNGTPLKAGDFVMIPGKIKNVSAGDEFCNVDVETTLGRRPDGEKNTLYALNTAQLILVEKGTDE